MSIGTGSSAASKIWSGWLSHQAIRRTLTLAWVLCCLAFLTLGGFSIQGAVWFVLFALTLGADILLYAATHGVADRATGALDERQQAVRDRAYRTAYAVVCSGIVVVVGGAMLLFFTGNEVAPWWFAAPSSHPATLAGFGVATLQLTAFLPTALVAWTEPDEPGELD
jgi:diacylglycerol kinase